MIQPIAFRSKVFNYMLRLDNLAVQAERSGRRVESWTGSAGVVLAVCSIILWELKAITGQWEPLPIVTGFFGLWLACDWLSSILLRWLRESGGYRTFVRPMATKVSRSSGSSNSLRPVFLISTSTARSSSTTAGSRAPGTMSSETKTCHRCERARELMRYAAVKLGWRSTRPSTRPSSSKKSPLKAPDQSVDGGESTGEGTQWKRPSRSQKGKKGNPVSSVGPKAKLPSSLPKKSPKERPKSNREERTRTPEGTFTSSQTEMTGDESESDLMKLPGSSGSIELLHVKH